MLMMSGVRHAGVIAETHSFYNKLKSGERENTEELSLQ